MISQFLSVALLVVCTGMLVAHFADIKKSNRKHG